MMSDITQENKMSVRDFVDAADVKGNFLYRKDGVILAYLRIYFFNIELMNQAERRALSNKLAAQFKADRKDFVYTTLPREVDMDKYRQSLKERHGSEIDLGRRFPCGVSARLADCRYIDRPVVSRRVGQNV